MAAMVACSLPTLMFPTLSLYISEVWSSGWCPFPLTVRESWIPLADLEYCDLGIANASVGALSFREVKAGTKADQAGMLLTGLFYDLPALLSYIPKDHLFRGGFYPQLVGPSHINH